MTIQLAQISRIEAYKDDLFSYDEILWHIYFKDGTATTISEQDSDWDVITASISSLPGFVTDWWETVAHPAFKENRTVIYSSAV